MNERLPANSGHMKEALLYVWGLFHWMPLSRGVGDLLQTAHSPSPRSNLYLTVLSQSI